MGSLTFGEFKTVKTKVNFALLKAIFLYLSFLGMWLVKKRKHIHFVSKDIFQADNSALIFSLFVCIYLTPSPIFSGIRMA